MGKVRNKWGGVKNMRRGDMPHPTLVGGGCSIFFLELKGGAVLIRKQR